MSRILRRPMFRGGSTNREGIMSVPRKGYADSDEGGVQGFDLSNYPYDYNEDNYIAAGKSDDETTTISPRLIKNEVNQIKDNRKTYKALGQDVEEGSYGDLLLKEYLGNRPDPLGKFLIQFGLNYMSARPKGGKFGALSTAAEAAKKPTEQLYADIDTDRLLKLKLMGALSKSESKVALEKEARLLVEQYPEKYPDMKTALAELMRIKAEKKATTPEERVAAREKSFETDQPGIKRVKAKLFELGIPKLGKEEKNIDLNNTFVGDSVKSELVQKPNSTDAQIATPPQNIDKIYKVGKIYIDINSRNAYKYAGSNTFRFVQSLE
jgi:hypothetical protein